MLSYERYINKTGLIFVRKKQDKADTLWKEEGGPERQSAYSPPSFFEI